MTPSRPSRSPGWPAWLVTWAAILGCALGGAGMLAALSLDAERTALQEALSAHLVAMAGEADGCLHEVPVEALAALNGAQSTATLARRVDDLAAHGGLRGLALIGPDDAVLGHEGRWVPLAAERDLLARARAGDRVVGPLYHDAAGALYQTAYTPLDGHPGWVIAVEGSAATLGAVDALGRLEALAGLAVGIIATLVSAGLAYALSRPLRALGDELAAARPGAPPEAIADRGFREVRQIAGAARGLLAAIVARDEELHAAHQREVQQLTRMAAGLAHEVGNPLNAIALSVERLAVLDDADRRRAVLERVRGQLVQLEAIVDRLRDLTRPLRPRPEDVDVAALVDGLDLGLPVRVEGSLRLGTDPVLLGQVLRNLALNAAQAGARSLSVTLAPATVTVTDDGPGVPEAEVDVIFDWFHTSRAAGSGLGLPVSRRIAEALGGTLELVQRQPATFRLTLGSLPCSP